MQTPAPSQQESVIGAIAADLVRFEATMAPVIRAVDEAYARFQAVQTTAT
jgi:hypothetical protein